MYTDPHPKMTVNCLCGKHALKKKKHSRGKKEPSVGRWGHWEEMCHEGHDLEEYSSLPGLSHLSAFPAHHDMSSFPQSSCFHPTPQLWNQPTMNYNHEQKENSSLSCTCQVLYLSDQRVMDRFW